MYVHHQKTHRSSTSIGSDKRRIPASSNPSAWPAGTYATPVYGEGYPAMYGTVWTSKGSTQNSCVQLFIEWSGQNSGLGGMCWRNARDNHDGFSAWQRVVAAGELDAKLDKPGGGNNTQVIQGDGSLILKETLQRLFLQGMVSGNPADGRSGSFNFSLNLYSGMGWISVNDGSGPDGNGWYGFVSIRHRGGSGDGNTYGHLLAMKRGSNRVWVKNYNNSTTGSGWQALAMANGDASQLIQGDGSLLNAPGYSNDNSLGARMLQTSRSNSNSSPVWFVVEGGDSSSTRYGYATAENAAAKLAVQPAFTNAFAAKGSKTTGGPSGTNTVLKVDDFSGYTLKLSSINVGGASHTHSVTI